MEERPISNVEMARERQRVTLEAIPRVLSVLGSYPIRPRRLRPQRPSPARLCGHPPFWIGRFLRARSFLSETFPSPLVLTPGGVEHPWLGSSTGTSNRLRMSWRLCRHWLRSATRASSSTAPLPSAQEKIWVTTTFLLIDRTVGCLNAPAAHQTGERSD